MKHKHAELIKAWADGAEIQCLDKISGCWFTCRPNWNTDLEFRIKPTPRPQWQQDLIDAAKAGKVVEVQNVIGQWVKSTLNDYPEKYNFSDAPQSDYRIRPEKVTRYLWAYKEHGKWFTSRLLTENEFNAGNEFKNHKRLDWSATEFEE